MSYYKKVLERALETQDRPEVRETHLAYCGALEAANSFMQAFQLVVQSMEEADEVKNGCS